MNPSPQSYHFREDRKGRPKTRSMQDKRSNAPEPANIEMSLVIRLARSAQPRILRLDFLSSKGRKLTFSVSTGDIKDLAGYTAVLSRWK